jgi:hypothetical protein
MSQYTNNDCEIIALEGKLQGLRKYLGDLMNIRANPMYKGDLTEEIDRVKGNIKESEVRLDECRIIKNGGKSDRGSI